VSLNIVNLLTFRNYGEELRLIAAASAAAFTFFHQIIYLKSHKHQSLWDGKLMKAVYSRVKPKSRVFVTNPDEYIRELYGSFVSELGKSHVVSGIRSTHQGQATFMFSNAQQLMPT
jgi:hypothetical protein